MSDQAGAATVFLNGRFMRQPVSGVQRFSAEITRAIGRLAAAAEWPRTTVLTPRPTAAGRSSAHEAASDGGGCLGSLAMREVGRTRGHLWEQTELPTAARGGVLVSLGNTAPVLSGWRQVVVIHDAGVYDTPESYSMRFRTWYKTLYLGLIRTGAQVATVSEFSKGRIVAHLGLDPARVVVTYEGADHILRVPPEPGTLARHNLQPGRYALVVGNRVAHKNLDALQHAAGMLARRGIGIVMTGGFDPLVFRGVSHAALRISGIGRVNDGQLRALYEDAACLLFPSRYEGFGLPPVEAMACGCPVIAARGSAVEEICGNSALYFGTDDPDSIVAALERLLDDDDARAALRARGRARAAALSWDESARALGVLVKRVH